MTRVHPFGGKDAKGNDRSLVKAVADTWDESSCDCGLSEDAQVLCLGCSCCCSLFWFIFFCVFVSAWHNLGPDDQILVKEGRMRLAYNGPQSLQMNPFKGKTWRKALRLDGSQYATLRYILNNTYTVEAGPVFRFVDPNYDIFRVGNKTRLARDDYIRVVDMRTGIESIVQGPGTFVPNFSQQGKDKQIFVEKAVVLTKEIGIVVRDKSTGELILKTACNTPLGPFMPTSTSVILETRERIMIAPHEAVIVRDVDGRTKVYSGQSGAEQHEMEGICDSSSDSDSAAGGLAFFLPALSRLVRMRWSNYSAPPQTAANLTSAANARLFSSSSARRRRSSKSRVVRTHQFSRQPRMWLVAGDFNKVDNLWVNRGYGPNITRLVRSGAAIVATTAANAPTAQMQALVGTTTTYLELGNVVSGTRFTICSLTRYTSTNRNVKKRILAGPGTWYHGHNNGLAGAGKIRPDTEWVPMCATSSGDVYVGDKAVNGSRPTRPTRLYVNGDSHKSDFAVAEVIIWNTAMSKYEMLEVQDYFKERLRDASTYVDQVDEASLLGNQVPRKDVVAIDLRTQKAFYKSQVQTNDNVRLVVEGAIFWQIVDIQRMIGATSDPEGDVYSTARSTLLQAVSNVSFQTFMAGFSEVVESALVENRKDVFWAERGLYLHSMEMTDYQPIDARTKASLLTIVANKAEKIVKLTKQRGNSEVRSEKIQADIAMEADRTSLIEARASNGRLEAQTRGATAGGRKARGISAFIEGLSQVFPGGMDERIELYELYLSQKSVLSATKSMFNGRASVFLKPRSTNITLLLPHKWEDKPSNISCDSADCAQALPALPAPASLPEPETATAPMSTVTQSTTTMARCEDSPFGWRDADGDSCDTYRAKNYCTPSGQRGVGWGVGQFSDYASGGKTGAQACCACGGGRSV